MGLNFEPGEGTFVTHLTFKQMVPKIIPLAQKHKGLAGFAFANHDDQIYFITNWSKSKIIGNFRGEMERLLYHINFDEELEDAFGPWGPTCKRDDATKEMFEKMYKLKPSLSTRPLHTLLFEKLKDCEVSNELEHGEIQIFGD